MRNIILQGNVLDRLKDMETGRVHCMITSPPYYGVRNYQTQPQIWKPEGYTACGEHEFYEGKKKHNLGGCSNKSTLRDTPGQKAKENWAKGVSCEHEFEEDNIKRTRGSLHGESAIVGNTISGISGNHINNGGFCIHCGAWKGELGLEPTPELYIEHIVQIFREIKRVLRKDGTAWLNLGDSYWGSWGNYGGQNRGNGKQREIINGSQAPNPAYNGLEDFIPPTATKHNYLKPKDLIGIPWRVAIALQSDGWWLRSDIIWSKKNPMPESVTDRPTKAHEYIFLLTKSQKYYYDAEAIREESVMDEGENRKGSLGKGPISEPTGKIAGFNHSGEGFVSNGGRNKRSVWEVTTTPFAEAHFATFPQKLVEPCILAGTSEHGVCAECGKPYERILEKVSKRDFLKDADKQYRSRATEHQITPKDQPNRGSVDKLRAEGATKGERMYNSKYNEAETGQQLNAFMREQTIVAERDESRIEAEELYPGDPMMQKKYINYIHEHGQLRKTKTIGWKKTCKCKTDKVKPAVVLDPFFGAGTTGLVALRSGRNFIGIELNENYIKIAEKRLAPFMLNLFDQPEEKVA